MVKLIIRDYTEISNNPPHRVLNVTEGERFSFAIFFDKYKKSGLI